jgi:hypothetical protein
MANAMPVASAAPRRLMQSPFSPFLTNSTTPALLGRQYRGARRLPARPAKPGRLNRRLYCRATLGRFVSRRRSEDQSFERCAIAL